MRYFLDESGHDGDIATAKSLDFSGQPVFTLACVGVADEPLLRAELNSLRARYGCGDGELKSSKLGGRLPAVASDLVDFFKQRQWPLFVELVDKRFFIAIHIVNHLLCGPYGLGDVDMISRNMIAEFLADEDSDAVLIAYVDSCRSPSVRAVASVIDLLWDWLDQSDAETARIAQVLTMYARDRARSPKAVVEEFLPIADESATGKKVWMLPNLQSLTNIYARINQSRPHGLDGAELVHDGQLQYAKVLVDSKVLMEKLADEASLPVAPFADYGLRGRGSLTFCSAEAEPCLQAADILAGCAMRFVRDGLKRTAPVDSALRGPFDEMIECGDPVTATGVNLVMSTRTLQRLGISHFPRRW